MTKRMKSRVENQGSGTAEEMPWTLANVSARRAMRGSTHRDAGRAQSGRLKRSAGRPARLADGAEFSTDDELGVPLLTRAAASVPPPAATAKRAKVQHEVVPSTDAGDPHARPSEETAAHHEDAAGERAPRRSGRHRTPSKRLADAMADAAGHQHGALIAPKRAADGQSPSADEGRPKKSRRLTAQLHPSIPEGDTPATLLPVEYIFSAGGGPHLDPSMHGKRPRTTPATFVSTTFVPITGTQAAPSHVAAAARTVCRSRRRQSRRKTAPAPAPGQPAAPSPFARPRATPLPSASLSPPQHAELLVGNPVSRPRWMACLLTMGEFPFQGDRSAEPRTVACNPALDVSGAAMFVASRGMGSLCF